MPRRLLPLALGLLCALPLAAYEKSAAPDPWQSALTFDYNVAAERFQKLHQASPKDARIAIAYASSLLVKQPRTESNIQSARDLLISARENAPASSEDAILALYLLARVELDHLDPAQPESARKHFDQLRREHPAHPLADHAAVELAYLAAYPESGADVTAIPAIQKLLDSVKDSGAARDLHSLLASLYLRESKDPASALPHYVAARAIGYEQPLRDADIDLTIANLARETGDLALARKHYAAFLAATPRDVRASTVRGILASLDATPAPSIR
ncbi:tetratricopeptide repeat protein [Rariglobus hedericola]|uniref:Tetratricopeptide repeat protein n=1 Tax=Rariglobus hedericola TaxID=2597822 RepID=A0A556QRL3_9BACT|nr:hypothetical protein [Rariglobus hedericola]TSJ79285.1 hypothetical protein FPL22_08330 [Rariglobus hedericola]